MFRADWGRFGRAAGMYGNAEMAEYGDGGLILWDGESRGTIDMIDKLRRLGKPVEMKWAICIELEGDCSDLVAPKVENLPCVVRED